MHFPQNYIFFRTGKKVGIWIQGRVSPHREVGIYPIASGQATVYTHIGYFAVIWGNTQFEAASDHADKTVSYNVL